MLTFILSIYLLSVINVFITERQTENSRGWCFFLALTHPIWQAIGGLLWLLVGLEKTIIRVFGGGKRT